MREVPLVSSSEAIKAFAKEGWQEVRQVGSHRILVKANTVGVLSVPERRELPRGTLRGLIRSAGLTIDEFRELL